MQFFEASSLSFNAVLNGALMERCCYGAALWVGCKATLTMLCGVDDVRQRFGCNAWLTTVTG